MGTFTHLLEEVISNQQIIKIFDGAQHELNRFTELTKQIRLFNMKNIVTSNIISPTVQMISVFALASVVYIASIQSASDQITVGEFISFFAAMAMLATPVKRITSVNSVLQRGLAASESVFKLIDQKAEYTPTTPINIDRAGIIEFNNVSMSYDDNKDMTLNNIQLMIHPNETVALIGTSGSGKSTLINLIPLFYAPTKGHISIDKVNIQDMSIKDLRGNIALVSQDVDLFDDTVAANIAYGSMENSSIEQIREAAKQAFALEFIEKLPDGFNSTIGEKGSRLSGGQRQRIAIARALLKNAPILILDEATSALDSNSEKQIQLALDELFKNRTTIMIAHRLTSISKADRIIVLDDGKIVEEGTHDSLHKLGGIYAHLYDLQLHESTSLI